MILSRSVKGDSVTADCWSWCWPSKVFVNSINTPKEFCSQFRNNQAKFSTKLFNNDKVYMSMSNDINNTVLGTIECLVLSDFFAKG